MVEAARSAGGGLQGRSDLGLEVYTESPFLGIWFWSPPRPGLPPTLPSQCGALLGGHVTAMVPREPLGIEASPLTEALGTHLGQERGPSGTMWHQRLEGQLHV